MIISFSDETYNWDERRSSGFYCLILFQLVWKTTHPVPLTHWRWRQEWELPANVLSFVQILWLEVIQEIKAFNRQMWRALNPHVRSLDFIKKECWDTQNFESVLVRIPCILNYRNAGLFLFPKKWLRIIGLKCQINWCISAYNRIQWT